MYTQGVTSSDDEIRFGRIVSDMISSMSSISQFSRTVMPDSL